MPAVPFIPLIASGVGAAASIYSGNQAAGAVGDAAAANNALAGQIWGQNQTNLNPFMQQGTQVNPVIAGALGYGDPSQARAAYDAFRGSTGYETNLKAGIDGLASNASTRGILNSGATAKAGIKYGQDLNNNYFQQWLGQVTGQQGVGLDAASALATGGQSYLSSVTGNNNAAAGARGNAWLNTGNQIGGLAGAFSSFPWGGGSSYGGGAGGG